MCAPDHPMRAMMGEQMIPTCEIPKSILSLVMRAFASSADDLGKETMITAIATSLGIHTAATVSRYVSEHGPLELPDDPEEPSFAGAVDSLGKTLVIGGALAIAAASGETLVEVLQKALDSAKATAEAHADHDPAARVREAGEHYRDQEVPDLVKIMFASVQNPEEKLRQLQEKLDRGEAKSPEMTQNTIEVLERVVTARNEGDREKFGGLLNYDEMLGTGNGKAITEDDVQQLLAELDDLPTADDPHDKKE